VFENIANGLVGTPWENAPYETQKKRVEDAARLAFAHDFIINLPSGYDSPVGQKGGLLSGGQKQRIAIARSIISEPKILLLDEATSALDPHAEGIVQQALDHAARNRTTIVIAHKLATIRNADNIVVMAKGRIVEQGRHEQLVAQGGTYANLVRAQDLSTTTALEKSESDLQDISREVSEPTPVVDRYRTAVAQELGQMQKREDYSLTPKAGLFHNVAMLVIATPALKYWYLAVFTCCIVGGETTSLNACPSRLMFPAAIFPGQALLLASVMDIFSSENMVGRGNFIALMYFVMSLGCLVIYFAMGWATNVVAQVCSQQC
jgi:ATP-binding cassette subfamily B (MDR/TAP) protein 1